MVGIKEVAAYAGVSISTVSYVFSGKRSVATSTKLKVLKAIQDLGYRPKLDEISSRNGGGKNLIALSSPMYEFTDSSNYAVFFFEIVKRARLYQYNVVLSTNENDVGDLLKMSYSGIIDGVILLDVVMKDSRVACASYSLVPFVSIGCSDDSSSLVSVDTDFERNGEKAIDVLYRLGHRHVLMVGPSRNLYDRGSNFLIRTKRAVLARAKLLGMKLTFVYSIGDDARLVGQILDEALKLDSNITAVMAQTSTHHMNNVLATLQRRGLNIPQDISILALGTYENITSLEQPIDVIPMQPGKTCVRGVDILMERIKGSGDKPGTVELIPSEYLKRGSVGPAPARYLS